ncbi:hypothetical protein GL58_19205 [Comamonas testosteroni]|uniref:Uncharacterized protein n=1 Tax=Comamonas testosteroni TaxID=285 RepID=A0A0L7MCI7_COMTE|nr:hypothetical protein GL58_19205 [Comamonas testosteroni]
MDLTGGMATTHDVAQQCGGRRSTSERALLSQHLHACHERGIIAAEFGTPLIVAQSEPSLGRRAQDRKAGFRLLERVDDLTVGEA